MIILATSPYKIAFIIAVVVLSIFILVLLIYLIYPRVKRMLYLKNFKQYYYKKIYKTALYRDFYLINDFPFKCDSKVALIDHILFGEKYIYFIIDKYYTGDLLGNAIDPSLIFVPRRGDKNYTDNPMIQISNYIKNISLITNLDKSLMIGIVLVNNQCNIAVKSNEKDCYIIQEKRFAQLIKAIESRDIGSMNEEELAKAVKNISLMKDKARKKK
ncbi:MAG: nuclease-related domain-containing protein [Bacilli bacterium]